jgi:O-antigen/teichoic acid export membrane protein
MVTHRLRVLIIAIGTALALIALVVLVALGEGEGTGFGVVAGVLGTLFPALLDSLGEQKRQRASISPPPGDST